MAAESLAAFPPPPPYYLLFRGDEHPAPPPPISGEYQCYGETFNADAHVPGKNAPAPSETHDSGQPVEARGELKGLGRELGVLILDLVDALVDRPSTFARGVEDISLIFRDIQHRLSDLRPQQARVTVLHILQMQLELRKQALAEIQEQRKTVRSLISKAGEELESAQNNAGLEGSM